MFKKITMTLASLALILGFSVATVAPASADSRVPLTSCFQFQAHFLSGSILDPDGQRWFYTPNFTAHSGGCNGVGVWNPHSNQDPVGFSMRIRLEPSGQVNTSEYGLSSGQGCCVTISQGIGTIPTGSQYRLEVWNMAWPSGSPALSNVSTWVED